MLLDRVEKIKLFRLLNALTPVEFKGFNRFLRLSAKYKNPHIVKLWAYIKNHYPDFSHLKLKKNTMHQRLFPERHDGLKFLTDRMSNIVGVLEEFLVLNEVKHDEALFNKIKIEVLRKKQLNRDFQSETYQAIQSMEDSSERDWRYFKQQWEYYHLWYHQPVSTQYKIGTEIILNRATDNRRLFQLVISLSYGCELLSKRQTFKEVFPYHIPKEVMARAETEGEKWPVVNLYYQLIRLYLKKPGQFDERKLNEVFGLYQEDYSQIGKIEQRSFLLKLINLVNVQIESGKEHLKRTCFKFFKFGVEKEILILAGKIPGVTFLNICNIGAVNQKHEWTLAFIEKYSSTFPSEVQASMKAFGRAYVFIHQSKPELADDELNKVTLTSFFDMLRKRSLKSRCLLEIFLDNKSMEQTLESELAGFKQLLEKEKQLSNKKKMSYGNLILGIRILIKMQKSKEEGELYIEGELGEERKSTAKLIAYEKQLEKLNPLISKKWLWHNFNKIAGK